MVAITSLSAGGAIAVTDRFYAVETVGVGGVTKDGGDFQELALDYVAGACLGAGLLSDPVHNDPSNTLTFALDDIAADQFLGRANGAGTGAPTVLSPAQARAILNYILTSAGAPSSTPDFAGQLNVDTTNDLIYAAVAAASSADWKRLGIIEQGTWNPVFDIATPGDLSLSVYAIQNGIYLRIGDWVLVIGQVRVTPTFTSASGLLEISVPLTIDASAGQTIVGGGIIPVINSAFTWPATSTNVTIGFNSSSNKINIRGNKSAANTSAFSAADIASGVEINIAFAGFYRTSD